MNKWVRKPNGTWSLGRFCIYHMRSGVYMPDDPSINISDQPDSFNKDYRYLAAAKKVVEKAAK